MALFASPTTNIPALLAVLGLTLAALHDIAVRTVPNWLSAAVAILALIEAAGQHRLAGSLVVSLALFVLAVGLWWRGLLGGGDAKLLAAAAPLLPPWQMPDLLLAVAMAGGLLAVPYLR